MVRRFHLDMSSTLMWLAACAVFVYSAIGVMALLGWLPMSGPTLSEETPAAPSGKTHHGSAIAGSETFEMVS